MKKGKLFPKVFLWMFLGLLVTGISSLYVVSNPNILMNVFGTSTFIILAIIQLAVVLFLSVRITKMSTVTAATCFLLYSLLTGVTCASILIVYQVDSIILMFGLTALLFLILGLIGYITNIDLSRIGNIFIFMLIGTILVSFVNIFLGSNLIDILVCIVGVVVFLGLVAYDIQTIKRMANLDVDENKVAIYGALTLYLDFINIFLNLLRLFGQTND